MWVVPESSNERQTMQQEEMDKEMRHQLDIKKGDTVQVIALATVDDWHNVRQKILFQEYYVASDPKRATPYQGYSYRNWMSAHLVAVDPYSKARTINESGDFYFNKIQIKKVKKKNIFPTTVARKKMLDKINSELNMKD